MRRELTVGERELLISAAKILKDSSGEDENSFIISVQEFPVKVPNINDIKTFVYVKI